MRRHQGPNNPPEPPPIWELPELPSLWTRLKHQARQRADRWLGERRRDDQRTDQHGAPADAPGQDAQPATRQTRRREDTASLRPPAAKSTGEDGEAGDDLAISSTVLESAYEAVRQGRITDPDTIRQLAAHFARLTTDDERGDDLGFDPREAVRQLRQRAAEMAQRHGIHDEQDPSPTNKGEGSRVREPRRPAPRMERDENILRGG